MEPKATGFLRRFLQTPLHNLLPISAATSPGEKETQALLRHLNREARRKEDWDAPLLDTRYIVVDTETTGFDPHTDALLSIGAVEMRGPQILQDQVYHSLLRPEPFQAIPPAVVALTGITDADVAQAPTLASELPKWLQFAKGGVLVMHHAAHDLRFLNAALHKKYGLTLSHRVLDTHDIAGWLHGSPLATLDDLLAFYEIPVVGRHTADGDAKMTAELWRRLLDALLQRGVTTLGELMEQVVLWKRKNHIF